MKPLLSLAVLLCLLTLSSAIFLKRVKRASLNYISPDCTSAQKMMGDRKKELDSAPPDRRVDIRVWWYIECDITGRWVPEQFYAEKNGRKMWFCVTETGKHLINLGYHIERPDCNVLRYGGSGGSTGRKPPGPVIDGNTGGNRLPTGRESRTDGMLADVRRVIDAWTSLRGLVVKVKAVVNEMQGLISYVEGRRGFV